MKNYPYVQATFGKSKRLYTFKLDPSILLMKDEEYDVTADGVGYNTPIHIKELLNEAPKGLEGIYLKTIDSARLVIKEDKDIENSEISFIWKFEIFKSFWYNIYINGKEWHRNRVNAGVKGLEIALDRFIRTLKI